MKVLRLVSGSRSDGMDLLLGDYEFQRRKAGQKCSAVDVYRMGVIIREYDVL